MHYNNTKEIWMNFVHFAQFIKGQPTKKWKAWVISNGHVLMKALKIKVQIYLYKGQIFDRPNGKAEFFARDWEPPMEDLSEEFPLALLQCVKSVTILAVQ